MSISTRNPEALLAEFRARYAAALVDDRIGVRLAALEQATEAYVRDRREAGAPILDVIATIEQVSRELRGRAEDLSEEGDVWCEAVHGVVLADCLETYGHPVSRAPPPTWLHEHRFGRSDAVERGRIADESAPKWRRPKE